MQNHIAMSAQRPAVFVHHHHSVPIVGEEKRDLTMNLQQTLMRLNIHIGQNTKKTQNRFLKSKRKKKHWIIHSHKCDIYSLHFLMKSHINLDGELEINLLPALIFDAFECPNYKKCFGFAVLCLWNVQIQIWNQPKWPN